MARRPRTAGDPARNRGRPTRRMPSRSQKRRRLATSCCLSTIM